MMRLLLFNLATDIDDPFLAFTTSWIWRLAERVTAIDVLTMRAGHIDVPPNVRVYSVGKEKGYSEPRRVLEFYRILLRLLRCHRYDGCFAHMMPLFAVMGFPFLRLKRIPIVLWYTHKSVTLILRLATLLVNRVVTASKESFRIPGKKVRIIGHGIETDRFVSREGCDAVETFTILTVSRLGRIKRIDLLIEAVASIKQRKPDVSLCLKIVGGPAAVQDHSYIEKLQQQVENAHLQDTVSFEGSILFEHVLPYYQQADCFVNLSETGSIDKAVLEAMSCEVPVVVNPVFADILGSELAGTWVIDHNSDQLCDRLLTLIAMSGDERQNLGKRLRKIVVKSHNLNRLCERLVQEFQVLHQV